MDLWIRWEETGQGPGNGEDRLWDRKEEESSASKGLVWCLGGNETLLNWELRERPGFQEMLSSVGMWWDEGPGGQLEDS